MHFPLPQILPSGLDIRISSDYKTEVLQHEKYRKSGVQKYPKFTQQIPRFCVSSLDRTTFY